MNGNSQPTVTIPVTLLRQWHTYTLDNVLCRQGIPLLKDFEAVLAQATTPVPPVAAGANDTFPSSGAADGSLPPPAPPNSGE